MSDLTPQAKSDLDTMIALARSVVSGQQQHAPVEALVQALAKTVVYLAGERLK